MSIRGLFLTCLALVAVGLGLAHHRLAYDNGRERTLYYSVGNGRRAVPVRWVDYETWAREKFLREHPNEKPLNWAIGEVAMRFYRNKPMGKFVLHKNDCSDFVECVIDEALGAQARFKRGSNVHLIGERTDAFAYWYWEPGQPIQPGDVIHVWHSPWYAPQPSTIGHVGVLGADGKVYDFVKLRRWRKARYARNDFDWFVRHSLKPQEVTIGRLKPEYRYLVKALP